MNINRRFTRFATACLAASFSTLCAAQSEQPVLEEIMVTATKRATTLQDTPLAISAFNQETLTKNHVVDLKDLRGMVPNLQFRENGDHNIPLIFIRGQGTADQTEAGDQGIAFYVDGVFAARSQGTTVMMYDLERIEVLRGPQGTLFGRNSTAGAIAMHTAMPKPEFDASGEMTFGSRNRQAMQGMINVPVTDSWALRFAGATDRQEGATKFAPGNEFSGSRNYGTRDLSSYRINSLFTPSDSLNWFVSFEKFVNQGTGDVPSIDPDNRVNDATAPGFVDLVSKNIRTRLDYTFGPELTFSYIGGFGSFDQSQLYGNETQGDVRHTVWSTYEGLQNEFQLRNSDDSRLRWTVGAFLFEEENGIRFDMRHPSWGMTPLDEPNTLSTFIQPDRSLDSQSFYAQGTFDITDVMRATLGFRYTDDERTDEGGRSIDCTNQPIGDLGFIYPTAADLPPGGGCWYRQNNDMVIQADNTTYMARVEYDFSDDLMGFISYGTGWKSGVLVDGQNTSDTGGAVDIAGNNLLAQQPEENGSFEIGVKSTWLDGRMTFNANVFFMTYTDMQVTGAVIDPVTDQSTLVKTNAGEASMEGIEIEWYLAATSNTRFSGTFAYLIAEYDEFLGAEDNFGNANGRIWNSCGPRGVNGDPNALTPNGLPANPCVDNVFNYAGNRLPYAPEITFSVSAEHDFVSGNGALWTPRIRLIYSDDVYLTKENRGDRPAGTNGPTDPGESNFDVQEAYSKVDVSLTYTSADSRWASEFYVNNATDEAIKQELFVGGNQTAYGWAPGRESGMRLKYSFE